MRNSQFYNSLSPDYDEMINFEKSLNNKIKSLNKFISPEYATALDLGCGSGADSIALTKLGLKVDAVDHSKGMLNQALENAKKYDTDINFIHSGLGKIDLHSEKYDLVVSLGNTIANIDEDELNSLMESLGNNINPNGKILIQLVNYSNLPKSGAHILNEFENEKISIIRKYLIHPTHIDFIIEKKNKLDSEESQIITKLYSHSVEYFTKIATVHKFKINCFGNLARKKYVIDNSPNLVIEFSN